MTFRGHMQGGMVVLDTECPLPDGTPVTVGLAEAISSAPSFKGHVDRALELSSKVPDADWETLPRDGASNVDHYLYGAVKST